MREDAPNVSTALAYGMLTATMACLALNHVIGRAMHEITPPVGLSFWRWIVAAVMMLPIVGRGFGRKWPIFRRHWWLFIVLGALMVGSTTLFFWTLQYTQAMNVSLISALQPAVTVALAFVLLRQQLSALQLAGILIGSLGVLAMVSQGSWQVLAALAFNRGDVITLLAVLGLSGYSICLRWLPQGLTPLDAVFGIIVAGCLVILPLYLLETTNSRPFPVTTESVGAVLTMGIFGSVAGSLMWNIGNQVLGPNKASIFINLIPVFGVIMAIVFLGETLHAYHLAGLAMICTGVWCVLARRVLAAGSAQA